MEVEVTPEQQKELNKIGMKYLFRNFINGVHHSLMLITVNFILIMGIPLMDGPMWLVYLLSAASAFFIFRRMNSISKASHDRLLQEIKKIVNIN